MASSISPLDEGGFHEERGTLKESSAVYSDVPVAQARAAAARVVAERAEGERRAKSAEDIAGSTPTEGETSKDFGDRVEAQKVATQTTAEISPSSTDKTEAPPAPVSRSWGDTISTAGRAAAGAAGYVYSKLPSIRPSGKASGGVDAAETPPPTPEQLRQMGAETTSTTQQRKAEGAVIASAKAIGADLQRQISPATQPSSSSHASKGEPLLSDSGPRREPESKRGSGWKPNAEYDSQKGERVTGALAAMDGMMSLVTLACNYFSPKVEEPYFPQRQEGGPSLAPKEKRGLLKRVRGFGKEVEDMNRLLTSRLDALQSHSDSHLKPELKAALDETSPTASNDDFFDATDKVVQHQAILDTKKGKKRTQSLSEDLSVTEGAQDRAHKLKIEIDDLYAALAQKEPLTQKDAGFVEEKIKTLEESMGPVKRTLLFEDVTTPTPARRRQRGCKAGRGTV